MSSTGLCTEGALLIAMSVRYLPCIEVLEMDDCPLHAAGAIVLANSFSTLAASIGPSTPCITFKHIKLSNARLGPHGACTLAESLRSVAGLQHLDVSGNNIG